MKNQIKLAVAGAVLSAASVANAGIIIPAGDWTLDINGNVNAFANWTTFDGNSADIEAGLFNDASATLEDGNGEDNTQGINTGLLPAWLGFTGTTSQNGVDVSFTISIQPGASDNGLTGDGALGDDSVNATVLNRQTFITFGTKEMGTVKIGKDLGIYASDAILNDMTLLGVGAGAGNSGAAGNTTLGGIGSGYQYAAWKGQVAYTTPNFNGFQATIGLVNPNSQAIGNNDMFQDRFGVEGKAHYAWTGDLSGKVWASFASYDVDYDTATQDNQITAFDVGATVSAGNFGLTGYWFEGNGSGTTLFGLHGVDGNFKKRKSDGGYLQGTYVIPTGTKLGLAYGVTNLDETNADEAGVGFTNVGASLVDQSSRWTIGAYHPLTKHLNLVAEYNDVEVQAHGSGVKDQEAKTFSLGAILFF
jgi:hypothetical protein